MNSIISNLSIHLLDPNCIRGLGLKPHGRLNMSQGNQIFAKIFLDQSERNNISLSFANNSNVDDYI